MMQDENEREWVIQREIPFARELVRKAMTEPAHQNWWEPDGTRYPDHSAFKEITPSSRWVFDHGDGQGVEVTITLEEAGAGTLVTLRQLYPNRESFDEAVEKYGALEGGKQRLAKLDAWVRESLSVENRSDSRCKLFPASPSEVFAALSNPDRVARWWGPAGFTNSIHLFEFHPGGKWLLTMHGPDGKDYPNESRFTRIEADRLCEIEHFGGHHFLLTLELRAKAGGTEVKWRQTFDTVEEYQALAEFVAVANEENLERLVAEVGHGKGAS